MDISGLDSVSFEELEVGIFDYVCRMARELTAKLLKDMDEHIKKTRDKSRFKIKQFRNDTIKTVYGEIEYDRRMYYDEQKQEYVFLLDEKLMMQKIGTISTHLAKIIAEAAADMPFRKAAELINTTTGISISPKGIWDVTQKVGKQIVGDEKEKIKQMKEDNCQGTIEAETLFMEADGVHLKMQKNKKKAKSQELKLATFYAGWKGDRLHNKRLYIGMEPAEKFQKKAEAVALSYYDEDTIKHRVLNADGATWITNTYNTDRIFQLDEFHIIEKTRACIKEKKIQTLIIKSYKEKNYENMITVIDTYINSIDEGKETKQLKDAKALLTYFTGNFDALERWQERIDVTAPEGIEYKRMGVQENQNCSYITTRMKGRKMRWSEHGANALAKIIYMRENKDLDRVIKKLDGQILLNDVDIDFTKISTRIPKKIGKGSKYVDVFNATIPLLSSSKNFTSMLMRNVSNYE